MSLSYLRSLLITDPLIILATVVYGSVSLVVSLSDPTGHRQIGVARAWARALLRISRVRVEVEGLDKIDVSRGYLVVSNHVSYMDTPCILANIPVQFRFLAKEGLFRIPFLGTHLKSAGHIPVPKDNPREALRMMADAAKRIRERHISLLIFPEGGRSLTGLQEFKEGAAFIAIKAGAPILPIGLKGTMEVLPMHSGHIRPGVVRLVVGEPVETAGLKIADRARLTEELRETVQRLIS